jgi:hypothetical protein
MIMEKSVEWLVGETEALGENLPQCRFPPQTPHAARTRTRAAAVGSQRLTAELRHGLSVVDIATGYGLDYRTVGVRVPVG